MNYDLSKILLNACLTNYKKPPVPLLNALLERARIKSYEPKEVLLRVGEIHSKIALILEGKAIATERIKYKKHLNWIWSPQDVIIHPSSSLQERSSDIEILFPIASTTLEINLMDLYRIREQYPELNYYFNQFLADKSRKLEQHIGWIKRSRGKDRIAQFREEHKNIYFIVPDEQKAHYLNMSLRWFQKNK